MMEMTRTILIAVVLCLSTFGNQAVAVAKFYDGYKLQALCEFDGVWHDAFCFGYVMGIVDHAMNDDVICVPNGVKAAQLPGVVKLWLRQHPESWHYAADSLVVNALNEKFPCN